MEFVEATEVKTVEVAPAVVETPKPKPQPKADEFDNDNNLEF